MKKFFILITTIFAALFAIAAEYKVMVLGDIHFESKEYHGVPGVNYPTKYASRYANMWKRAMPELFKASAAQLDKDFPFVIQLGDFTQGYLALPEQRAKMLVDSFNTVKGYYPSHKLLFTKGNHDTKVHGPKYVKDKDGKKTLVMVKDKKGNEVAAIAQGWDNATYAKAFVPVIEKELGQKAGSHYAFRQGEDLYIFFDGMIKASTAFNFVRDTLKKNPQNRYVFFITHLPILPCSTGVPGWLAPRSSEIFDLLIQHNTVILAAHTHIPSLVKVKGEKGSISQLVVSSIGYNWNTGKPFGNFINNRDEFFKHLTPKKQNNKRARAPLALLKSLNVETFELYSNATGFVVLKVGDKGIDAEIYNAPTGKPAAVKKLK
ncbi:MAG: metallophosphoesterase [Lentisphaeria bacterium]|nr:metallophosphoesterase [Lentisphaeria bacterium]